MRFAGESFERVRAVNTDLHFPRLERKHFSEQTRNRQVVLGVKYLDRGVALIDSLIRRLLGFS